LEKKKRAKANINTLKASFEKRCNRLSDTDN